MRDDTPGETPRLKTIYLHVTNFCNLKCKHCWVNSRFIKKGLNKELISSSISVKNYIKRALNEAYDLGLEDILIGGGEPLLVKDLVIDIIKYSRSFGVIVRVETNGLLINGDLANFFSKYECQVSVSLDSAKTDYFDSFRGLRGAFNKVIDAIKILVRNGVLTRAIMTITRTNMHHVEDTVNLALDLGVSLIRVNPVHPIGRAEKLQDILQLKDVIELSYILMKLYDKYFGRINTSLPLSLFIVHGSKYVRLAEGRCNYKELLGILPDGGVSLCAVGLYKPELIIGNIRRDSIYDIWYSNKGFLKELRMLRPDDLDGICKKCILKYYCAIKCPAQVYLKFGTFRASYPLCQELYKAGLFPQELVKNV